MRVLMAGFVLLAVAGCDAPGQSAGGVVQLSPTPSSAAPASSLAPHRYADARSLGGQVAYKVTLKSPYHFEVVPGEGGVAKPAEGYAAVKPFTGARKSIVDDLDLAGTVRTPLREGRAPDDLRFATVQGEAYAKLPPEFEKAPGKPWLPLPRGLDSELNNNLLDVHDELAQTIALSGYHLPIIAAGGEITDAGFESLNTRYKITVDLKKASERLTDAYLKEEMAIGLQAGGQSYDYELLVSPHDEPLELKLLVKVVGTGKVVTTEVRFSEWGKPVTIAKPADDEIFRR